MSHGHHNIYHYCVMPRCNSDSTYMQTHMKAHIHTPARRQLLASLWQCVGEKHLGYLDSVP